VAFCWFGLHVFMVVLVSCVNNKVCHAVISVRCVRSIRAV